MIDDGFFKRFPKADVILGQHVMCMPAGTIGGRVGVTTSAADRIVTIRAVLSGTPCRCMCGSTLRTRLGLAAGAWTVVVELASTPGRPPGEVARERVMATP